MRRLKRHLYHIVNPSPWPFFISINILPVTIGAVMYFHEFRFGGFFLSLGLINLLTCMTLWFRDVIREATYLGEHTSIVQKAHRLGFILFIFSEVMFFFSFFWAFFDLAVEPSVFIGAAWPPDGIATLNSFAIPLLNTLILIFSGVTITYTHYSLIAARYKRTFIGYILTLTLATAFTALQLYEYEVSTFTISDGVYGSTFYMITGLHGSHVIVGTIFILVCCIRTSAGHFTTQHHLGFEFATWYWHFVDAVWLFVYAFIYVWGSY
jgi:heme/copper-type cytochrome/quinol oxidase subunit 3